MHDKNSTFKFPCAQQHIFSPEFQQFRNVTHFQMRTFPNFNNLLPGIFPPNRTTATYAALIQISYLKPPEISTFFQIFYERRINSDHNTVPL